MDRLDQCLLDAPIEHGVEGMAPVGGLGDIKAETACLKARIGVVLDGEEVDAGMIAHQIGHARASPGRG